MIRAGRGGGGLRSHKTGRPYPVSDAAHHPRGHLMSGEGGRCDEEPLLLGWLRGTL